MLILNHLAGFGSGGRVSRGGLLSRIEYVGTGSAQTIITGQDLLTEGGLVWIRPLGFSADGFFVFDTVRGAGNGLRPTLTFGESILNNYHTAFNKDGVSVGSALSPANAPHILFGWLKRSGYLDIVTYTGNGGGINSIPHGLGSVPKMMIIKQRSAPQSWPVYHASVNQSNLVFLNLTSGQGGNTSVFANTAPTNTRFSVGATSLTNASGEQYVAYLFAELPGQSKFGSFAPTNSTPTLINCGFSPKTILTKRVTGTAGTTADAGAWYMTYLNNAGQTRWLRPNAADAENGGGGTGMQGIQITDSGFTLPAPPAGSGYSDVAGSYIYAAWA